MSIEYCVTWLDILIRARTILKIQSNVSTDVTYKILDTAINSALVAEVTAMLHIVIQSSTTSIGKARLTRQRVEPQQRLPCPSEQQPRRVRLVQRSSEKPIVGWDTSESSA